MVKAKKIVAAKPYEGEPKLENFKLVEEELPPLKDGEILCESEWISVDPYQRMFADLFQMGSPVIGTQIAKIIESKHPKFPAGKYIFTNYGWRTHAVINPEVIPEHSLWICNYLVDFGGLSRSYGLGALGNSGNTAYFGLLEVCKPKAGDVVVVSGAAGAVGSLVGQIAKLKGCTVIGYAGSDAKVEWLKKEIGFAFAFNYKKVDVSDSLKEAAPKGVDCYFDNVGGSFSNAVFNNMKTRGRIAVCGAVSTYNDDATSTTLAPAVQPIMLKKQLLMEGFICSRWDDQWQDGIKQMATWIREGKIKTQESITEGFENLPKALIGVMRGANTGKAVVKV